MEGQTDGGSTRETTGGRASDGPEPVGYWEWLHHLSMYSLQRRHNSHLVICVWKTHEKLVPDMGFQMNHHLRKGWLCYITRTQPTTKRIVTVVHNSFTRKGVCLFNVVPQAIKELTGNSTDSFKHQLDRWLASIPDNPQHQHQFFDCPTPPKKLSCLTTAEAHLSCVREVKFYK